MNRERLLKSAKKFGIDIKFEVEKPGVFDASSNTFFTFDELLGDIFSSEEKNEINKKNKILKENYKLNDEKKYSEVNVKYNVKESGYSQSVRLGQTNKEWAA